MALEQFARLVFCSLTRSIIQPAFRLHCLHWLFSFSPSLRRSLSHLQLSLIISSISGTEIHSVLRYSQLYISHTGCILISHKRGLSCVRGIRSCQEERKKENTARLIHAHFSLALFPLIYKTHFLEFSCCLRYMTRASFGKRILWILPLRFIVPNPVWKKWCKNLKCSK